MFEQVSVLLCELVRISIVMHIGYDHPDRTHLVNLLLLSQLPHNAIFAY